MSSLDSLLFYLQHLFQRVMKWLTRVYTDMSTDHIYKIISCATIHVNYEQDIDELLA